MQMKAVAEARAVFPFPLRKFNPAGRYLPESGRYPRDVSPEKQRIAAIKTTDPDGQEFKGKKREARHEDFSGRGSLLFSISGTYLL